MHKCFILFVSVSIATLCHDVQSQSKSTCRTPNGDTGDCVRIEDCDPLLSLLSTSKDSLQAAQLLKDSQCGPQDQEVCCPRECFTPDEQLGKCVGMNSCPTILNMLLVNQSQATNDYVRNSKCESKDEESVCCGPPPRAPPSLKARCSALSSAPPDRRGRCCGRDSDVADEIFGRTYVTLDQYPWLAIIEYRTNTSLKDMCGGALVSGKYVLTAAHCVLGTTWTVYPVSVRLGEYDIDNEGRDCIMMAGGGLDCNDGAIVIPIQRTIPHPEFTPDSRLPKNDIALIRLKDTAIYTDFIRPICLPTSDVFVDPPQELELIAAGWGISDTDAKTSGNVKLHVELPYKTLEFCAGGDKGKEPCPEGSGGPLMYQKDLEDPVFEIVGVISLGLGCGNENIPGVYTKVYEYLPWIRSQITS